MVINRLKENDALKKVDSPQEYQYMKWIQLHLNCVGGWPNTTNDNISKWSLYIRRYKIIEITVGLISQSIFVVNNYGKYSFFIMGQMYITILLNVVLVSRTILHCTEKYGKLGRDFINNMHIYHHKDLSEVTLKNHILIHKISHYYTLILLFLVSSGIILFNLTPLYNNISSGAFNNPRPENVTFEHSIYFALPFDCFTDIGGYIFIFILNFYLSHNTSTLNCTVDLFLSLMILHLWGHLRILIHDLKSIPNPQSSGFRYTDEENHTVSLKLRRCIRHHNFIIGFATKMSDTYDVVIAIYYIFFQVSCCLMLLQCSTLELKAITRYGPMTFVTFQELIQISLIFELLGYLSEKLPDAVYNVPWECMNTSNRKMVQMLLMKSQTPIQFRVLNAFNIGVQTMTSILKSSVSYFIMLRTIDNN